MKMKTTKFLAVLAVLAMAFVAFAAVAPAEEQDAATAEIKDFDEFKTALTTGGEYKLTKSLNGELGSETTVAKDLSIDFNGYKITITDQHVIVVGGENTPVKLVLKDSTLTKAPTEVNLDWASEKKVTNGSAFSVEKNGSIEMYKINFNTSKTALYPNGQASSVLVEDCKIVGGIYAIGTNAAVSNTNTVTITVTNCELESGTGNTEKDDCTLMANIPKVTLSVTGSKITGDRQAVFLRCGTATIEDTEIVFKNDSTYKDVHKYDDGTIWGSGNETVSSAIVVGSNDEEDYIPYAGTAKLTLNGVTVKTNQGTDLDTSEKVPTTATNNMLVTYCDANNTAEVVFGSKATKFSFCETGASTYTEVFSIKNATSVATMVGSGGTAIPGFVISKEVVTVAKYLEVIGEITTTLPVLQMTDDVKIAGSMTLKTGSSLTVGKKAFIESIAADSNIKIGTNSTGGFNASVTGTVIAGANLSLGEKSQKDTITILKGATLTVQTKVIIGDNGAMTIKGTLAANDKKVLFVNNGTVTIDGGKIGASDTEFASVISGSVPGAIEGAIYATETSTTTNVYIDGLKAESVPSSGELSGEVYESTTPVTKNLTVKDDATLVAETITSESITVEEGKKIVIQTDSFTGTVYAKGKDATPSIYFENVKGTFTVKEGSVEISGTIESGTVKILDNDAKLVGGLTIESGASLQIASGKTLDLNGFTLTNHGTVYGDGSIDATGSGTIDSDGNLYVYVIADEIPVHDTVELINALKTASNIRLENSITLTDSVTIPEKKIINLNGNQIIIPADMTLTITKSRIQYGSVPGIVVDGGVFKIVTADVLTPVQKKSGTIIVDEKVQTISGQSITTNISVGYGNTLILDGITIETGNSIYVYGDLQVKNRVIVNSGATISIARYGTSTVEGTLQVAGTIRVVGSMSIDGTVTVAGNVGTNALFQVTSAQYEGVYVNLGGTFTVSKPSNNLYTNTLRVEPAGDYYNFSVYGTLNIYGSMDAIIYDAGDVTIQGTITDYSSITIADGVTLNVNSIVGEPLLVTDNNILNSALKNLKGQSYGSDSNRIVLEDVKNMTITESITTVVESDGSLKYFYANMDIAGSVATTDAIGSIIVIAAEDAYYYTTDGTRHSTENEPVGPSGSKRFGNIYVTDAIALGKNVKLSFYGGTFIVDGSITALAEGTDILNYADGTNDAFTVNGSITMGGKNNSEVKIDSTVALNAAYFTQTDANMDVTGYYGSFDGAFAYIADADEKTISTYGKVTQTGEATLAAGQTINVTAGSELKVKGTFIAEKESSISNNADINVTGILVINDYYGILTGKEPSADVMFAAEPMRTYCSLSGAIKAGQTDIVLYKDVILMSNLTIPAGVTVSSDTYGITVSKGKVLTVEGAIELDAGTITLKAGSGSTPDAALVVNGHVFVHKEKAAGLANVDGAHFLKTVNGIDKVFITSIEYAAENTTTAYGEYKISIVGKVVGGDVVFTPGSYGSITITVDQRAGDVVNYLAVKSISLKPDVTLIVNKATGTNNAGRFAGEIYAYTGDGTEMSSIVVTEGTSFVANASAVEKVAGMEYYLNLNSNGSAFGGSFIIDEGTVTINAASTIGTATGDSFVVGSDTELVIDAFDVTIANTDTKNVHFAVLGLVTIDGKKLDIKSPVVIAGEIDVINGGILEINAKTAILGDIYVSEELGKVGYFYIKENIYLGTAPTELDAEGSIVGEAELTVGKYIVVYPGFDLSMAKLNWNPAEEKSKLVYTDYIIGDTLYMTVLAVDGETAVTKPILDPAVEFEIDGIQNDLLTKQGTYAANTMDYWFIDDGYAKRLSTSDDVNVGYYDTVYAKVVAANVDATITVGAGLYLYIDGKAIPAVHDKYTLSVGVHTVSTELLAGYDGDNVKITFNGNIVPVTASGALITVTSDMDYVVLVADGAVPHVEPEPEPVTPEEKSEWTVTTILLCVLVVLIAIMAVIVALRLNRN